MKSTILALATCTAFLAPRAEAVSYVFQIGGLHSEGLFPTNFPTLTHDFGAPGTIVSVTWDVSYESFPNSWQREAQIAIDTNLDPSVDADLNPKFYGAVEAPGIFSYSGTIAADSASDDGLVFLTLYESFDDDVNPDAIYFPQSFVEVEYEFSPDSGGGTDVPDSGATALLLGLSFLGLAGAMRKVRSPKQTSRRS